MLVDDRDPGRDCFMRAGKFHGFAIDEDVAGSWTLRANDAFDQRRFASAVLTQKGVNFAMPDVETDAIERARAGILLGQTANFEHRHGQIVSRSRDGSNSFSEGHAVTVVSLDVQAGSAARNVSEISSKHYFFAARASPEKRTQKPNFGLSPLAGAVSFVTRDGASVSSLDAGILPSRAAAVTSTAVGPLRSTS